MFSVVSWWESNFYSRCMSKLVKSSINSHRCIIKLSTLNGGTAMATNTNADKSPERTKNFSTAFFSVCHFRWCEHISTNAEREREIQTQTHIHGSARHRRWMHFSGSSQTMFARNFSILIKWNERVCALGYDFDRNEHTSKSMVAPSESSVCFSFSFHPFFFSRFDLMRSWQLISVHQISRLAYESQLAIYTFGLAVNQGDHKPTNFSIKTLFYACVMFVSSQQR